MFRVTTPQRMQALERAYMESSGVASLALMERAAKAVANALEQMTARGALFLCGPGNNGGDGYAAARLFAHSGRRAYLWTMTDPQALRGDARENWQRCEQLGIPIARIDAFPQPVPDDCDVVVDALFGTGLDRPLEGLFADAVRWMNVSGLPVLAVDMPSGTPALMTYATQTVAFHQLKTSHLLFPGRVHSGEVSVADIGIPPEDSPEEYEVLDAGDAPNLLPPRALDAHKGDAGHALLVAGSHGMAGAAALSANAALRGGAGLVTVACPSEVLPIAQTLAPCATCVTPHDLEAALHGKAAVGAGPGLGLSHLADKALPLLLSLPCPQVWDADALNWLALRPQPLDARFVLTPHPGEAARLLGREARDVAADPLDAASALHDRYKATILLKGATTILVGDGRRAMNIVGSPGMATGGSGDVLCGLVLALLTQGIAPFDAAQAAALLHGIAGSRAATNRGIRSMTAMDLLDALHID